MAYHLFIAATLAGSAIWFLFLLTLGYTFGEHVDAVRPYMTEFVVGAIVIGVIILVVMYLRGRKKS